MAATVSEAERRERVARQGSAPVAQSRERSGTVSEAERRERVARQGSAPGVESSEQSGTVSEPERLSGPLGAVTGARWGAAAAGTARVFGATARGLALDLVSATARAGEMATDALSRRGAPGDAPRPALGSSTLRVEVLILSDEYGMPVTTPDRLETSLALADRTFTERAGLRVRCAGIRTIAQPAPTSALDPHADRGLLVDEIVGRTAFYRQHLASPDFPWWGIR